MKAKYRVCVCVCVCVCYVSKNKTILWSWNDTQGYLHLAHNLKVYMALYLDQVEGPVSFLYSLLE